MRTRLIAAAPLVFDLMNGAPAREGRPDGREVLLRQIVDGKIVLPTTVKSG